MRFSPSAASLASAALSAATLSCLLSCSSTTSSPGGSVAVTQTIGPTGGTIAVDGATVTFPAGAVSQSTTITITSSADPPPDGFVAISKVFECQPSGTSFSAPVTMTMPFADDGQGALTMFWSSQAEPAFTDVGGAKNADGKTWSATVMHFSSGFVGRKK